MSWGHATEAEGTSDCRDKRRMKLIQATEAAGASDGCAADACFSPRSMYRVNYYEATEAAGTSDGCGWAAASSDKGGKGKAT